VIVVEHDLQVVAGSDWVIDMGPGAGDEGGHIVAAGPPAELAQVAASRTAPYLEVSDACHLSAITRQRHQVCRLTAIRADGYEELGGNCPPQETLSVQQWLRFPLQQ
jgi:hypothetical protein